jgi:flotillin
MKNHGYIVANPAEFLIHQRFGKTRRTGREISFLCLPLIDRCYRIPSSTHALTFAADQITAENQGVEISGFAIWKVAEPEKACRNFDFNDPGEAMRRIGANLKDVVESAIRHQVANMTIEDVLRRRGSIILRLKEELAYIAGQWGLAIETIEIKNVRISSEKLFENMQAKFRDEVRLESETSGLETDREIAERRFSHRAQLALKEQEFNKGEASRKAEIDALNARAAAELAALKEQQDTDLKMRRLRQAEELARIEHANREKLLRLDEQTRLTERETQKARHAVEIEKQEHLAAIAAQQDRMERQRIETANLASPALALVENLAAAAGALKVNELNLGDNTLTRIANGLAAFTGSKKE